MLRKPMIRIQKHGSPAPVPGEDVKETDSYITLQRLTNRRGWTGGRRACSTPGIAALPKAQAVERGGRNVRVVPTVLPEVQ